MSDTHVGFDAMTKYPLFDALRNRRSRRISLGLPSVKAGSNSYTSNARPQPLSDLEEAVLISAIGLTGITFPDRPFESPEGENILGTPNLNFPGRAAGSTDNCQATHFFLINDSGVYYLKRLDSADLSEPITPDLLVRRAAQSKIKILNKRPDFPREFPNYLDSNRFLSNVPGSTILYPVVDMTRQYINALMYLLTEPDGHRPAFLDDRNFYLPAGVGKWIRNGFLNKNIKLPLGYLGTMRTQIEAELLLQNLILMLQAMGLGGWIHSAVSTTALLPALGFTSITPRYRWLDFFRWGTFHTEVRTQPIGLPPYIECMCPPFYPSMADAVQAVIDSKYQAGGTYNDDAYFRRIFQGDRGEKYLREVPHYSDDVIACTKDICTYIYRRHAASRRIAMRFTRRASGCRRIISTCITTTPCSTPATPRRSANISSAGTVSECGGAGRINDDAYILRNSDDGAGKINFCRRVVPRADRARSRRR